MGLGLGLVLIVSFVLIILYAVRRSLEGAALRKASQLAAQGQPALALRELLKAEEHWGFNTAHDVRSTRVAALDRLGSIVQLAQELTRALGRPIDIQEITYAIESLRGLLGTKAHYSWGSDASLKSEFKVHLQPLMGQLGAARGRLRAACSQACA